MTSLYMTQSIEKSKVNGKGPSHFFYSSSTSEPSRKRKLPPKNRESFDR